MLGANFAVMAMAQYDAMIQNEISRRDAEKAHLRTLTPEARAEYYAAKKEAEQVARQERLIRAIERQNEIAATQTNGNGVLPFALGAIIGLSVDN